MKTSIHPQYSHDVVVTCACGSTFTTGSTKPSMSVDICSACHPFYTGEMKFVDTQGRVEKFQQKLKQAAKAYVSKRDRRQGSKQAQPVTSPTSLRDLLKTQTSQG